MPARQPTVRNAAPGSSRTQPEPLEVLSSRLGNGSSRSAIKRQGDVLLPFSFVWSYCSLAATNFDRAPCTKAVQPCTHICTWTATGSGADQLLASDFVASRLRTLPLGA